jgi:hypothetical protein
MQPEAAPTLLVLVKALARARSSGASEIGIEHLLAALNADALAQPTAAFNGPYVAVPPYGMPLAPDVIAALKPLGDISKVSLDTFRSALVAAKNLRGD